MKIAGQEDKKTQGELVSCHCEMCLMRPLQNSLKGFGSRDWEGRFVGEAVKQIYSQQF